VEFPGRVPDAELVQRLSSCDVCVNPDPKTPFNDASTMTKILDYMSVAKAIVQFDVLEGRRSAGEASLYARPNDPEDLAAKIVQLLDDPAARERMGRAGRERMETALQWRLQMPNLLAAYDRAMKVRRRRRGRRGRPRRRPGVVASRTRPR
jgi:glycosyltransferase involved in cell wall biosynthesis